MAAVDGAGPMTRSRIEAFDQTAAILTNSATQWRVQAQRLQWAADSYVDQVSTPNGTEWTGQTAVSYFETAHADRLAVSPAFTNSPPATLARKSLRTPPQTTTARAPSTPSTTTPGKKDPTSRPPYRLSHPWKAYRPRASAPRSKGR